MRIVEGTVFVVHLPINSRSCYVPSGRQYTSNLLVCLRTDLGQTGWGEAIVPDSNLESTNDAIAQLISSLYAEHLSQETFQHWEQILEWGRRFATVAIPDQTAIDNWNAAHCALELACLDAAGRCFKHSVNEITGIRKREWVEYCEPIQSTSAMRIMMQVLRARLCGRKTYKFSCKTRSTVARQVRLIRRLIGPHSEIWFDADGAWDLPTAMDVLQSLWPSHLSAVEQPLPADCIEDLQSLTMALATPVVADQSLITMEDAQRLVNQDACDYFSVSINKCGGIFPTLSIIEFARTHDKACLLSSSPQETSLLAAASRHLALGIAGFKTVEGAHGKRVLKCDIVKQRVRYNWRGRGYPLSGAGLGVEVDSTAVERHITYQHSITPSVQTHH